MKYSDCLLDNFDDVCKHSLNGIEFTKDILSFWKRRQLIEEEYSKNLQKLCKSVLEGDPKKKTSANQGRLYESWMSLVSEIDHIAILHKQFSVQVGKLLVEGTQNMIREAEAQRKQLVVEGSKARDELQDAYTVLKKAKDNRDKLQKEALETEENAAKAPKVKDISKLMTRAQLAREKAKASEIQVDQCGLIAEEKQEMFYKQWMPSIMDKFQALEVNRITFTKDALGSSALLEGRLPPKVKAGCDRIQTLLEDVNIEEEISLFITEHVSDSRYNNVSVTSLQAATMKGRLMKAASNTWRSRYLVLMGQQSLIYIFESEDSLKPQDIVNLKHAFIRPVHDSLYSKKFCFQIISFNEPQVFSAEDEIQAYEWLENLKASSVGLAINDYLATPRRINYVSIQVTEAKQLPAVDPIRRSANPFCVLFLDSMKQAVTQTIYNTTQPLWNEKIFLDDVPSFESCKIKVVSRSTFPMKDVDLASLDLPKSLMESGQVQDQWFPLMASSTLNSSSGMLVFSDVDEESISRMSIRVKAEFKSELVFPLSEYDDFVKALLADDMVPLKLLFETSDDRERITSLIIRVWHGMHCALNNLRSLISAEIDATEDSQILFRANSLATKSTEQYMRNVGVDYLQQVLGNPMKQVLTSKYSCEIDDTRIMDGEDVQRNAKRLIAHVKSFLDSIFASAEQCPNEMRFLFHIIQEKVLQKFKGDTKIRYIAISGFIFLRLFCPAIISPWLFGMCTEHPDDRTLRTLKLIAKILQTLANVVEDSKGKEAYMVDISDFITENIPLMKAFIEEISSVPKATFPPRKTVVDIARELESIKSCFLVNREKIAHHADSNHPSIEALFIEIHKLLNKSLQVSLKATEDPTRKLTSEFSIGLY